MKTESEINFVLGDITLLKVDAIVNAANNRLLGGGGVDGAIHSAAGSDLLEACRALNGCATGSAKITRGFNLPARYVIHTVGPIWYGGGEGEAELLASCYKNSLILAEQYELYSLAIPAISCGVYGYPADQAAEIAISTVIEVLNTGNYVKSVTFCLFSLDMLETYQKVFQRLDDY